MFLFFCHLTVAPPPKKTTSITILWPGSTDQQLFLPTDGAMELRNKPNSQVDFYRYIQWIGLRELLNRKP